MIQEGRELLAGRVRLNATFNELAEELKLAPVHHVAGPLLGHFSAHSLLRSQMIMQLDNLGVQVWAVAP